MLLSPTLYKTQATHDERFVNERLTFSLAIGSCIHPLEVHDHPLGRCVVLKGLRLLKVREVSKMAQTESRAGHPYDSISPKVNKQNFLQIFQGSGIGKME